MSIIIRDIEYEVIKELGKGGFGRVIQVKSKSDNKIYAIKEIIIKDEMEISVENIKNEANILSKFNCNNIVKYYDSCENKDKFYILMEFCANVLGIISNALANPNTTNCSLPDIFIPSFLTYLLNSIKI